MNTQTTKPRITILAPHTYRVTSDTGHAYTVRPRAAKCVCRGFHVHGNCKHLRLAVNFEIAIAQAQSIEARREVARRERQEQQRINSKMYGFYFG